MLLWITFENIFPHLSPPLQCAFVSTLSELLIAPVEVVALCDEGTGGPRIKVTNMSHAC